jgi:hypothetical protein
VKEADYSEPVSRLLTYGEADWDEWDDYTEFGFTGQHIPELIRLGTDRHLLVDDDVDDVAMWAPMHAWRVLAQMYALESIAPLVQVLSLVDESNSDLINEGFRDVLERFGPVAIDPLASFLTESGAEGGLIGASEALAHIGKDHPEHRDRTVQIITAALDTRYVQNDPMVNGFWISDLLDLQAVESYPIIQKAYEAGAADPMICGDLEDVEVELGLLEERKTPRPLTPFQHAVGLGLERGSRKPKPFLQIDADKIAKKEKVKRKQEKKSRKKNRKKK